MKLELEVITPERAKVLLEQNDNNRPANKSHVAFLGSQMKEGAWKVTGDPIKIGVDGRLLDGQHRLAAVVYAGLPMAMYIAYDVPDDVFTVLDTGKNRTARDVLHIDGMKSASSQAALARALMAYYDGKINNRARTYTNGEVMEYCRAHDLLPSVNIGVMYASKGAPLKASIISIVHFILCAIDKEGAEKFLNDLCLGVNIRQNTAEYLLSEKLRKAQLGRYDLSRWETVAVIIKTWNMVRTGEKLPSMIIFNPEKENFPIAA